MSMDVVAGIKGQMPGIIAALDAYLGANALTLTVDELGISPYTSGNGGEVELRTEDGRRLTFDVRWLEDAWCVTPVRRKPLDGLRRLRRGKPRSQWEIRCPRSDAFNPPADPSLPIN